MAGESTVLAFGVRGLPSSTKKGFMDTIEGLSGTAQPVGLGELLSPSIEEWLSASDRRRVERLGNACVNLLLAGWRQRHIEASTLSS